MQLKVVAARRAGLVDAIRDIIYDLYEGTDEELEAATTRIVNATISEIASAAEWQPDEEFIDDDDDD